MGLKLTLVEQSHQIPTIMYEASAGAAILYILPWYLNFQKTMIRAATLSLFTSHRSQVTDFSAHSKNHPSIPRNYWIKAIHAGLILTVHSVFIISPNLKCYQNCWRIFREFSELWKMLLNDWESGYPHFQSKTSSLKV